MSVTKGVILIGGPSKGTRMRPLSLDCELIHAIQNVSKLTIGPKPLLPVAGKVRHELGYSTTEN